MKCGLCPVDHGYMYFCPLDTSQNLSSGCICCLNQCFQEKKYNESISPSTTTYSQKQLQLQGQVSHITWRIILSTRFSTSPLRSWNHNHSSGIMVGVCYRVLVRQRSRRTTLIVNAAAPAIVQTPVRTKVDVTIAAWPNGIELTASFCLLIGVILLVEPSENHRATGRLGRIRSDIQ